MNDYTADGTMADWMAGQLNVPYSITFEMFGTPGDLPNCFEQFNPRGNLVQQTLERIHGMYTAAFIHLINEVFGPHTFRQDPSLSVFILFAFLFFLGSHLTRSAGTRRVAPSWNEHRIPSTQGRGERLGILSIKGLSRWRSDRGLADKRSW